MSSQVACQERARASRLKDSTRACSPHARCHLRHFERCCTIPRNSTVRATLRNSTVSTDGFIQGEPTKEYIDPAVAYQYLARTQAAACKGKRTIAFARLSTFGVANDLNSAVKALHIANARLSQLVFLPPAGADISTLNLASRPDVSHPWHWLPDQPLSDVLNLSACHRHLLEHNRSWLERVAAEGLTSRLQSALPFVTRLLNFNWRQGVYLRQVPVKFRTQGVLWWWSVLSTYLVRPVGQLASRLEHSPALKGLPLPWRLDMSELALNFRSGTDAALFDVGLHVRMGDACGANAIPQASRLCVRTLREALQRVELRSNSTVFLATDSDAIVESVADVRREWPALRIYHLSLTRAKYDSQTRIERRVHIDRAQILSEALLDMAFLSLSRRIVGAMIGNLPRLALQLRVRRTYNYTALDSRAWCTRTACKLPAYRAADGV